MFNSLCDPQTKKFGDLALTNKVRFLLSITDFANYTKFFFSWPAWAVYGFAIATKESKPHSHQSLLQPGGSERCSLPQNFELQLNRLLAFSCLVPFTKIFACVCISARQLVHSNVIFVADDQIEDFKNRRKTNHWRLKEARLTVSNESSSIFKPVADDQAFEEQLNKGAPKVFTCLNTPASLRQSLGITQKWLPFLGQQNGYFWWSNYAIFQGITTV